MALGICPALTLGSPRLREFSAKGNYLVMSVGWQEAALEFPDALGHPVSQDHWWHAQTR